LQLKFEENFNSYNYSKYFFDENGDVDIDKFEQYFRETFKDYYVDKNDPEYEIIAKEKEQMLKDITKQNIEAMNAVRSIYDSDYAKNFKKKLVTYLENVERDNVSKEYAKEGFDYMHSKDYSLAVEKLELALINSNEDNLYIKILANQGLISAYTNNNEPIKALEAIYHFSDYMGKYAKEVSNLDVGMTKKDREEFEFRIEFLKNSKKEIGINDLK
jgi:hypothetical protein